MPSNNKIIKTMKKKNLSEGFKTIFNTKDADADANANASIEETKSKSNNETVCFRCGRDIIRKVRFIAATERTSLKVVMEAALSEAIQRYEEKKGAIVVQDQPDISSLFK